MIDVKEFSVEVTEANLDAALAVKNDDTCQEAVTEYCIMAQAVRPIVKGSWVSADAIVKRNNLADDWHLFQEWKGDHNAERIVQLFDDAEFDTIRAMLPVTVHFIPVSYLQGR